ncbi:GFA family protein [Lysobacter gummosus]|uniref:GFA family protein n=1 Tax=Lysobacter gummosus TaxID=262324 RepID=A0ABY3XH41_9GAMM|nr:GFA family protein [Lysobacter gummosus]ALN90424.1 glutathione-dependent formaldehyde-activating enzyme family protein [Lysobacter gummosus]UNP30951.1 GFA family protein [Lysobacter gummosus]
MATYTGSCHCGKVAYEVEGQIDQTIDCNCSMCQRRGGLLWFVPRAAFSLKSDPAEVGTYRFNKHSIDHHFCRNCGIAPYSEASMPDGTPMTAINVRCLDGVDLTSLKIVPIDGRSF